MSLECNPGDVIEVDDLLEYIEENAVPGPEGPPGPPGECADNAYLLDGTREIVAAFAGGAQQFKDAEDATDGKDLTTLVQVEAKLEIGVYNTQTRTADAKKGL